MIPTIYSQSYFSTKHLKRKTSKNLTHIKFTITQKSIPSAFIIRAINNNLPDSVF